MSGKTGRRLSKGQERALAALLVCDSLSDAAALAQVPERTLRHWRATDPQFQAALAGAGRLAWGHAILRASRLAVKAVKTLERAMECNSQGLDARRMAVETRAALGLLSHLRDAELAELSDRVQALEAARGKGGLL